MAGYCTSVWPYFHEPQASENTAQECNIQPYCLLTHTTVILVAPSCKIDSYCASLAWPHPFPQEREGVW